MNKQYGMILEKISNESDGLDLKISPSKDSNGLITNGICLGNTLFQNEYIILNAHPGDIKEYPKLGVGISDILNDNNLRYWYKYIRINLAIDDMIVDKLEYNSSTSKLVINSHYSV